MHGLRSATMGAMLCFGLFFARGAWAQSPTVTTDKPDYSPGETVIITGAGWQPGETVLMVLHEEPTTHADISLSSVVEAGGNFTNTDFTVEAHDVGVTFTLTATGQSSGWMAQTTFTDTDPTAQSLPYSQDFSGLAHSSTTYPAGWQGWTLAGSPSTSFRTIAPTADENLIASSSASTTTGGVHNYNGKIGILASGATDPSLCLAISTTGHSNITVTFDIMTIRNPFNGGTNTRINQVDLQYRVGTSGSFTSVSGNSNGIYESNTTTQTTSGVTTPQNLQTKIFTLPSACDNQANVQLRWVQRDVTGGGSRPSFAVDNISICPGVGAAGTITGSSSVCANATGVIYSISAVSGATSYTWTVPSGASIASGQGTTSITVNWGSTSGNVTVSPSNSCNTGTSSSLVVTINPLPTVFSVTGGGSYCSGGIGTSVGLSGSQTGVDYQLVLNGTTNVGSPVAGTGSAISFGNQTTAGTYTVIATNATTLCQQTMTGSATVTVNPLPTAFNVTGGGSFCSGGTGVAVGLDGSQTGVNYQLILNGTTNVGSPIAGTGSALSFGDQTTAETYTVVATNATTSCQQNMTGSAIVTVNSSPTAFNVTGGGSYCSGGAGIAVGLDGSETGVNYQLVLNGTMNVGSPVAGTGSALSFGNQTTAGTYTVVATNTSTLCQQTMTGSATVTVNPLPTAFNVTGGGSYCSGGAGVAVGLDGSETGVSYQLVLNGTMNVGSPVAGTGSAISFDNQTTAGTYTVVANTGTLCEKNMSGSVTVTVNPLPTALNVTGGGSYCSGGTGVAVGLDGSETFVNYQLVLNGTTNVGSLLTGTGSAISFGNQTTAGTYTVVATNATTSCQQNMNGSATVTVSTSSMAFNVTGGGAYCSGGTGVAVGLGGSETGVNYQLVLNGTTNVGSSVAGTGSAISFGNKTAAGTYTIVATNATTLCQQNMTGSATVTVNPNPTCSITPPSQPPTCGSTGNSLSGQAGFASYSWSISSPGNSWVITSANNLQTITYTAGSSGPATFTLTVNDANNCQGTCQTQISCTAPAVAFCSFPQSFYGNSGNSFNGQSILAIVQSLITSSSPLVVGKTSATRSLAIPDGTESCIVLRLPATGAKPGTLPSGNGTMSAGNCQSSPPQPLETNGKWKNMLLGQTVALALNLRFATNLGNFALCNQFKTRKALPGSDGLLGTADDVPDPSDPGSVYTIPPAALNLLAANALPNTVTGLLELANRGLAGQIQFTGGASLADVNQAVDAINRGFDRCRFLLCCSSSCAGMLAKAGGEESAETQLEYALEVNYPNPFNPTTIVQFTLPERTVVSLKVYNMLGQEVAALVNHVEYEAGYHALEFNASGLVSGVYFYRLQAGSFTSTRRMLLAK